ncbi:MAG TPA: hypothetical protein VMU76_06230 [Acidimicrobiales bacterium]|nr:hypothetical protein [Acidimicrobiales bacterium]
MADAPDRGSHRFEGFDHVLVLDSELEPSTAALQLDDTILSRRDRGADEPGIVEPGATSAVAPVTFAGVEQGNAATEILDPFVRAIEVLLQGLAGALGERGSPATITFGSMIIEYSGLGLGDDVVRVHRTGPAPSGQVTDPSADQGDRQALRVTADRWELGASAAREGDHAGALELFEAEAREAEAQNIHQRAAIAYRSASREAGWIGRRDYANKLLRLAGKHYLFVAEDVHVAAQGKVRAFVTAAKCFLQAGNLSLAESCIARARSGAQALSDTE